MSNIFEHFLYEHGINYDIERKGTVINSLIGLRNTDKDNGKYYIGFLPGSDIKSADVLINTSGERAYIISVETSFAHHEPLELKAYIIAESEINNLKPQPSIFNIQNAYNSIIGTQSVATINYTDTINEMRKKANAETEDNAQLQTLIDLLEMVVNNQVPANKGLFSKFSELMEKHSWLSGSIASTIISWLFSNAVH